MSRPTCLLKWEDASGYDHLEEVESILDFLSKNMVDIGDDLVRSGNIVKLFVRIDGVWFEL